MLFSALYRVRLSCISLWRDERRYVFVLNMIGIHAGVLVLMGRFSSQLHHAYTIWFIIGTTGAVLGPARYLVGWQPFQSMEQLGPFGVFIALQLLQVCEIIKARAARKGS